jgi:hypothetical protein
MQLHCQIILSFVGEQIMLFPATVEQRPSTKVGNDAGR